MNATKDEAPSAVSGKESKMKKAKSIWFDGDSWESLSKEVKLGWVKGFVEAVY